MHPDANGLISRATALRAGYTNTDLQRLCARGELVRIVPGMYAQRQLCSTLDPRGMHRLTAIVSLAINADAAVASDVSAAVLHGLDLWSTDVDRVHLTIPGGTGRTTSRLHVHSTSLPAQFVALKDGIAVTAVDRTVVDCARLLDLDHAVVIGDSLVQEKIRDDRLRDRGLEVFRWTWKDLWQFGMVRERFDRACARAERRR